MMGSTGPADAATDTFVRNLGAEIGPHGVRVVGIWTAGLPETFSREKLNAVNSGMQLDEEAFAGLLAQLDRCGYPPLPAAGRGGRYGRVPGLGPGGRDHRHVRQRHQRDVHELTDQRDTGATPGGPQGQEPRLHSFL